MSQKPLEIAWTENISNLINGSCGSKHVYNRKNLIHTLLFIISWIILITAVIPIRSTQIITNSTYAATLDASYPYIVIIYLVASVIMLQFKFVNKVRLIISGILLLCFLIWTVHLYTKLGIPIWVVMILTSIGIVIVYINIILLVVLISEKCKSTFIGYIGCTILFSVPNICLTILSFNKVILPNSVFKSRLRLFLITNVPLFLLIIYVKVVYSLLSFHTNEIPYILTQDDETDDFIGQKKKIDAISLLEKKRKIQFIARAVLLYFLVALILLFHIFSIYSLFDSIGDYFYILIVSNVIVAVTIIVIIPFTTSGARVSVKQALISNALFTAAYATILIINHSAKLNIVTYYSISLPCFSAYISIIIYLYKTSQLFLVTIAGLSLFGVVIFLTYTVPLYLYVGIAKFSVGSWAVSIVSGLCLLCIAIVSLIKAITELRQFVKAKRRVKEINCSNSTLLLNSLMTICNQCLIINAIVPQFFTLTISQLKLGIVMSFGLMGLFFNLELNLINSLLSNQSANNNFEMGAPSNTNKMDALKENRCQKVLIIFGIICLPGLLAVGIGTFSTQSVRYGLISFLIIHTLLLVILVVIIEARKKINKAMKRICLPISSCCIHISIILPFCSILPFLLVFYDKTSHVTSVIQASVGFFCVSFIVGVTIASSVIHELVKMMEGETMIRYISNYLVKQLSEKAVRCSVDIARQIVDAYFIRNCNSDDQEETKLWEDLSNQKIIYYWTIPEKDPDVNHSKMLIAIDKYQQLKKGEYKLNDENQPIAKKRRCCKICYEEEEESLERKQTVDEPSDIVLNAIKEASSARQILNDASAYVKPVDIYASK